MCFSSSGQKSKTSSDSQAPLEFVPLSIPRILEWPPNPDEHLLLGKDLHIQKTFNSGTTSATIRNSLGISKRDLRLQPSARGPPPLPLINADTFLEWYRHNKPLPAPPSTFSAYPSSNYESLYVKDDFKRRASVASSSTFISTTPMSEYNYESSRVLDELIDELMMRPTSTPPDQTYYAITINHYESANNSTTRCSNPRHNDMSWPSCAPTHMLVMVGNTFGAFKSRETLIDGNGFVIPRCDDFGFTPYDLFWVRDSSGPFYLRSYLQIQAEKLNVLWFKDKSLGHVYAVKFSARASLYAPPTGTQWVDRIGPDYEAVPTLPLERY